MKVGIIGCGAIGLLTAGFLDRHHEVTLYARRESHAEELNRDGFTLEMEDGQRTFHIKTERIEDISPKDVMLICVKQPALPDVLKNLTALPHVPLLFLQNGMGHEELAAQLQNPVYIGISEHGALKVSPNRVKRRGAGRIVAGLLQGDADDFRSVMDALDMPDYPFEMSENIKEIQQLKLLANAVINPVTAVFRVENGRLLENRELEELAKGLSLEAAAALIMDPHRTWEYCRDIIKKTSTNRSSMLQDIERGRPTEADAILGYLVNKGDYPTIGFFYKSIKALEALAKEGESR